MSVLSTDDCIVVKRRKKKKRRDKALPISSKGEMWLIGLYTKESDMCFT